MQKLSVKYEIETLLIGLNNDKLTRYIKRVIKLSKTSKCNIQILPRMSHSEIIEKYRESDIFVLASHHETFGVAYIEAMLSGLPVIATKCGGPEEFVNENCGILIEPDNVEQLVDALKKMISNYRDYSRQKIHDYAASKFSPDVVAAQIIDVYKTLVN